MRKTTIPHKKIFLKTAIFTTLIFLAGILVGYYIDDLRSTDILDTLLASELDAQSYITEKEFLDTFGEYNCQSAANRLSSLAEELGEIGYYLVNYEKKNIFQQENYDYLLRKYFLMQIRTYTLFTEMKTNCETDYDVILFFFDPDDVLSARQGRVLDVLVNERENLSIFSFNVKYDGDVLAESFRQHHNITVTPTVLVNEGLPQAEFVSKEALVALL